MMKQEVKRQAGKRSGLWLRDKKIFERDKIIYRKVGKELIATYADKGIYYEQTIHSCHITDKRFKTKFVLGLFNSTLFKFYYRKTNSQGGDIFPQVRISSVENLPIKLADTKTQEKIETLVDQILTKKAQDPSADTTNLENQIDQLVYQLYELTEEEIAIVEKSVK
jgi:restriction endonuclease S subunit